MNFLHPWFLAVGAVAVALPLVIHWLTKPRPRPLPLSTIRFVREAVQQKRSRYRLRDWLVLLLRASAVALLAWAFARPLTGAKPLVTAGAPGDAVRVVLLDCSLSMSATNNGQIAFDRAKADAAGYLQYSTGLRGDLLLAAARPNAVFGSASSNFAALRDALTSATARPERIDVQAAINRAAETFSKAPHAAGARMELVIISDFQRSSWARADFSPVPAGVLLQFDSVAPTETPGNLGILKVGAVGRIEQNRDVRLQAEIGNYSKTPRQVDLDIAVGDSTLRLAGLCPPGVATTLAGTITPRTTGWLAGNARLIGSTDALAGDDQRPFVLNVRPPPTYALITRESPKPHVSSSHFLERALVPVKTPDNQPGERVIRLDPAQPDRDALGAATLIVVDHPGKLSPQTIDLLAGLVRRGRGMLYIAAEPIDATNLKLLADAAGNDLRMPVEFQPPPADRARENLFLLDWKKDQPPFGQMADTMTAVAGSLRFSGGLSSRRLEGGLQDDILATYSDRSAALVITSLGAGSLAILNVDLTDSNLPSSPVLVPMIGELCGRLLSTNQTTDALPCGEPLAAYLPSDTTTLDGLTVTGPGGKKQDDAVLSQEASFIMWRADAAGPPGVYQVIRDKHVLYALATAAPGSESDLQPLDPNTLKTRLAAGRPVYFQGAGDEPPKDQQWAWLLVACSLCIIGEFGLLKLFRT